MKPLAQSALLTDLYQLTMASAAWKSGALRREAVFHLSFRKPPFKSGYSIACGLGDAVDYVSGLRFEEDDLAYLATLPDAGGQPLFEPAFLSYLRELEPKVDIDAVPEGTAVFPHEPLLRVSGPIIPCMLLETPLLNSINFQTLIATKAARVCHAARGEPVIEFGLRRAQGPDGAVAASRAAYVGGATGTSNVLAGKRLGIPLRGTHAHSWVMLFDDEREAFEQYARAMPRNCIFLVDTYDSLRGVQNAIAVGRELRARGHELLGIRLDSGDLAWLSAEARKLLDAAGFKNAAILGSNDLDEHLIESLKLQGAEISVWCVGTRLVTGGDESALGGVYKLAAVRDPGGPWQHRIKISEQTAKITIPGVLQIRRFQRDGELVADMIYDVERGCPTSIVVDPIDLTRRKIVEPGTPHEDLLVPVVRAGKPVGTRPTLAASRARTQVQLALLHPGIKRLVNPHGYPVGLEKELSDYRTSFVLKARGVAA